MAQPLEYLNAMSILTKRVLLGLLAALLAMAVSWVATNGPWADLPPQPIPAALAVQTVQLAPEDNGFLDLQGMQAPEGQDAHVAGLRAWQAAYQQPALGAPWPQWPAGLNCSPRREDCVARWQGDQVQAQTWLHAVAELHGPRCMAAGARAGIEELLPATIVSAPPDARQMPPTADLSAVSRCVRWWLVRAALAGSPPEALQHLTQANQFARKALAGSRSSHAALVAAREAEHVWLVAAQLAAAAPGLKPSQLTPLLAPLPAHTLHPRVWVPFEASYQRLAIRSAGVNSRDCALPPGVSQTPLGLWLCLTGLGWLPEHTVQASDALWLARLAHVRGDGPGDGPLRCDQLREPPWTGSPKQQAWPWRNPVGAWLLASDAGFGDTAARLVDLDLLRLSLRASLLGEPQPAGARLTRANGHQQFAACWAQLFPERHDTSVRVPLPPDQT